MSRPDEWSAAWIAKHIVDKNDHQKDLVDASPLSGNLLKVQRKRDVVLVGTLGVSPLVQRSDVKWALGQSEGIAFVANVPSKARFAGDAISFAKEHGAGLGGFGDLRNALSLQDPASYVDRETAFRERGLAQHSRVKSFVRVDDCKYTVARHAHGDVTVVFLYDYDLGADAVRAALADYGKFSAIVKMNPNGGISTQASTVAANAGRRILGWGEFLGELNRKWT